MHIEKQCRWFADCFGKPTAIKYIPAIQYRAPDMAVSLDTRSIPELAVEKLVEHATATGDVKLAARLNALLNLASNPDGAVIKNLEKLELALIEYIRPTLHKFLFKEEADGYLVPFYVDCVSYNPRTKHSPPNVEMNLKAISMGSVEDVTLRWYAGGMGSTVSQLVQEKGYYLETTKAYDNWLVELARLNAIYNLTGEQFRASGFAHGGRYGSTLTAMSRDSGASRVVMDYGGDSIDEDGHAVHRSAPKSEVADLSFWMAKKGGEDDDSEKSAEIPTMALPIHPYTQVFHFEDHEHYVIHVNGLVPYVYDETLAEKLILPDDTKELVEVLVSGANETMEDIVSGKTGGVVVIATGEPGTGKTLTAEVYSEQIKRPLYAVQCSQLGTNATHLEKRLDLVLSRAARWRAILLIDEADVYVRARGDSIDQNAIVGVFLRLLEHYRGVMFLTSNRATIIDDAILSRAIAHLRYEYPDAKLLRRIWQVLSTNYKAGLSADDIGALLTYFPRLSGRNVKTLLKLATAMTRSKKEQITVKHLRSAAKFLDLPAQKAETET